MKLDRELQNIILNELEKNYPNAERYLLLENKLSNDPFNYTPGIIAANAYYLAEHGLIELKKTTMTSTHTSAKITADGMDFLAEDGGIGAILGVVTVRLHDETIRNLIEKAIIQQDPPDKQRLIDQLRSLPADATKHLTMRLLDAGLDNWPTALHAIQTFLGR